MTAGSSTSSTRSVILLALLSGIALATNPDEQSFQRFVDAKLKGEGASWLDRKVVSHVSALIYERKDFKLFSVVSVPENQTVYIGVFGIWLPLPTFEGLRRMVQSATD